MMAVIGHDPIHLLDNDTHRWLVEATEKLRVDFDFYIGTERPPHPQVVRNIEGTARKFEAVADDLCVLAERLRRKAASARDRLDVIVHKPPSDARTEAER